MSIIRKGQETWRTLSKENVGPYDCVYEPIIIQNQGNQAPFFSEQTEVQNSEEDWKFSKESYAKRKCSSPWSYTKYHRTPFKPLHLSKSGDPGAIFI